MDSEFYIDNSGVQMSEKERLISLKEGGLRFSQAQLRSLGLTDGDQLSVSDLDEGVYLIQKLVEDRDAISGGEKRATLKGDIGSFFLADMISMLHANRKTGILHVSIKDVDATKSVYFKDGEVVFASSSLIEDRLGESLRRSGKVTAAQIEGIQKELTPRKKIGKVLVEKGFISPKELWMGVRRQVEEIVYSLFRYRKGKFVFLEGEVEQEKIVTISLMTHKLIMEGIRRVDEWARFVEKIPSGDVIFTKIKPPPDLELNPDEQAVLDLVDAERTVSQICEASGKAEFDTYRALYYLVQVGFVTLREGEAFEVTGRGWGIDRCREVLEKMNPILMDIYSIFKNKAPDADVGGILSSFFSDLTGDIANVFKGVSLDEKGGLAIAEIMANLGKLTDDERGPFFLRAMNELLYFELFELKHYLKKGEAEELMEIINKMKAAT